MRRRAQPWLGTMVEISIADDAEDAACDRAFAQAFAVVARVHGLMSFHDQDSDVSRFNRAASGSKMSVDPMTWAVLDTALTVGRASDGMFDIGCAPVLAARGYLPPPAPARPEAGPAHTLLTLAPSSHVKKHRPGWIDLGGIAKGYAVDAAVDALRDAGVSAACVNAGGDLRVFGARSFTVAVRDPLRPHISACSLSLQDEALATSAGYFSRRRIRGQEHTALVDGRDGHNGRPLGLDVSASVRAPRCVLADALTKAVLAGGDVRHPVLAAFGASAFTLP